MTCEKCGGPLYLDRRSVDQLARAGYEGGRIYCRLGCMDLWVKRRVLAPFSEFAAGPGARGKYERPMRTYLCQGCGQPGQSRGNNARWCEPCKLAARQARERDRYVQQLRPRRRRTSAA